MIFNSCKISAKNHLFSFILSSFLLLIFQSAFASVPNVTVFKYKNIGKQVSYLEDKDGKLDLEAVLKVSPNQFSAGKQDILNFGNTTSAWWIKIDYLSIKQLPIYLIVDAPNIEHITVFTTDSSGRPVQLHAGSLVPENKGVKVSNNFVLSLPVANKDQAKTMYIRLKTNNILLVPLKLATSENIMTGSTIKVSIEYIYIGLLIALLLFNLFLFISIKDITYLYYVLYVLTLSSYLLIYIRGYGFLFGDDLRILFNLHPHLFLSFSVITSLIFCGKFLHLNKMAPKMKKFFYALGICGIILFFTSLFGYKHLSAAIAQILTVTVAVVVWIAGIIAYRNGHRPAKYYIIAWFFIWITVAIVTLTLGGIIQPSEFTIQLIPIGSTFELLLLSFALGDRYKVIMQTEQKLRDENLLLVRTQNQRLEESVMERTLQLSNTINELENANAVKNKLFSIIAHDLRSPLNSLMSILSLNEMQALSLDELAQLLKQNKNTIDSIYNTLNNLLYWAQAQMNGIITQIGQFNYKSLLEELLFLYLPLIKPKQINIQSKIEYDGLVSADQNQINLVIRNLIDNAIKFTPIGGAISVTLTVKDEKAVFEIENEIDDANEINLENLSGTQIAAAAYGTKNERGVGLGLLLCNEYVRNNGDSIKVELKENRIKFSFALPIVEKQYDKNL